MESLCDESDWEVSDESEGEAESKPEPVIL